MSNETSVPYNSENDTSAHIFRVQDLMRDQCYVISKRGRNHDDSKRYTPEKEIFDRVTPRLKSLTYGSDEYRASLEELKPALDHHYANNSHHPEHYEAGIQSMNLFDLLEMLADWKAAGERHSNGSLKKSFEINRSRFQIPFPLYASLISTAREMQWLTEAEVEELLLPDWKAASLTPESA